MESVVGFEYWTVLTYIIQQLKEIRNWIVEAGKEISKELLLSCCLVVLSSLFSEVLLLSLFPF